MGQHLKALAVVLFLGALGVWAFKSFYVTKLQEVPAALRSLEGMETLGAPNFNVKDIRGVPFDLQSLKGKVVILNFWASWCGPCVEEVPSLIKLVREFKGELTLVAISGDSAIEDIEIFLKSFPELKEAHIHVVWDADRSLMKQFYVARLPESLVLDRDQKLVKKIVGSIDWYSKDSISYMKSLLSR